MSIVQQINEGLQALGFSQSLAAQLDQFIAFLGVLLVAYLADTVCRKILLKVVSRLVKQTKATWDDIVFDRKVMVHLSRMVAPILIYILLPLAFSDAESATLALILRFCLIFIIIMFLSFISALLTAVYTVYSEKEQFRDRPLKGLLQTVQVILYFVGGIIVVSILIDRRCISRRSGSFGCRADVSIQRQYHGLCFRCATFCQQYAESRRLDHYA